MKLGKPENWAYANGTFECECTKCHEQIGDNEPRYIPLNFVSGRLCIYCFIKYVEKRVVQ